MKINKTILAISAFALFFTYACKDDDGPVNVPPVADFTIGGSDPYYMDTEISFMDNSSDTDGSVVAWFWDFGDGNTSTQQNPTHTYTTRATYTVSLTVTDDGGATGTISKTINIRDIADDNLPPTATFTVSQSLVLNGSDVEFTNASTDPDGVIVSHVWDFGDGSGTSEEVNPSYTFNEVGIYEVTLSVTDDIGATATFTETIYVAGIVWSSPMGERVQSSAPAIADDGRIFMTLAGKDGIPNVHGFNPDGTEIWNLEVGDIVRTSATISDDGSTIYFGSYDDNIYSVNSATGVINWSAPLLHNARHTTPAIATDGTVYIGSQGGRFFAFNPTDGSEKWRFSTDGQVNGSPVIGTDGTVYVHTTGNFLFALNPTDGSEKWRYEYGNWSATALAMTAEGNIIVSGERDGQTGVVASVSPAGTPLWSINTLAVSGSGTNTGKIDQGGAAVGPDGTIYIGTKGPELLALNPQDGSVKWSYTRPEFAGIGATPAIDDRGFIYFGDDSGLFIVLDPNGNLVFELSLGSKIWASVTIGDDGLVYIGADQEEGGSLLHALNFHAAGPANSSWPMRHGNRKHNARL